MLDKTYSEEMAEVLTGKMVEVHTGDTRHSQQYSDYTINKKSVVRGKLVGAKGDMIIVDCIVTDHKGHPLPDRFTRAYINGWNVLLITDYNPGTNIVNIFQDEDSLIK